MKCCYFAGGSILPSEYPELEALVERYITQHGVDTFVVGRSGSLDRMAASAAIAAKARHPQVRLVLLLPCHPADRSWKLPEGFDESFYLGSAETPIRRPSRKEVRAYMTRHCHFVVDCSGPGGSLRELIRDTSPSQQDGPPPPQNETENAASNNLDFFAHPV